MTHRDYWAKREDEALKHYITEEAEYDKEVQRIYKNQLDAIQTQINAFYGKYAAKENITISEAKKRVSKLDIAEYERKAAKYVKERNFSAKANEELRLYNATMKINRLEMLKANIGLEMIASTDELDKFMEGILKGRTEAELARQAGILGKTIRHNAQTVNAVVNASFHNATFSDRVWMNQELLKNQLSGLLQTGLIQGKNPRVLAREIRALYIGEPRLKNGKKGAVYSAERLMRTELARVQTEAQKQSLQHNGFAMYEFIANRNCCDACQALDGKHFKVKDMMPGHNAAPIHPHCRCSVAPWEDSTEFDAWLDHLANGGTTEQWETYSAMKQAQDVKISEKQEKNSYSVDRHLVNSKEYRDKFEKLPISKNARQSAYYESKAILEHRDGSYFEDVAVIDSRTGKFIVKNNTYEVPFKSAMKKDEYAKVTNHNGGVIIIHNHAEGTRLSGTDILTAFSTKNAEMSIAIGHNGELHCIYEINRKIDVDKIYKDVYNAVLENYGNKDLANIKATDALYKSGAFKYSVW